MSNRDDYDCGNALYDHITGGPEYRRWRRRRDLLDHLLMILGVVVMCSAVVALLIVCATI